VCSRSHLLASSWLAMVVVSAGGTIETVTEPNQLAQFCRGMLAEHDGTAVAGVYVVHGEPGVPLPYAVLRELAEIRDRSGGSSPSPHDSPCTASPPSHPSLSLPCPDCIPLCSVSPLAAMPCSSTANARSPSSRGGQSWTPKELLRLQTSGRLPQTRGCIRHRAGFPGDNCCGYLRGHLFGKCKQFGSCSVPVSAGAARFSSVAKTAAGDVGGEYATTGAPAALIFLRAVVGISFGLGWQDACLPEPPSHQWGSGWSQLLRRGGLSV
jgi:hypothetical protein